MTSRAGRIGLENAAPSAWRLAKAAFVTGAVVRVITVLAVQALHGSFLFLDDQGYDQIGWSLAQAWSRHTFPSPASYAYAGTLSYLYYVLVAAVYYVFGHHWVVLKVVAALLSALSVPAAAAVGDALGGRRLAVRAAWLAALYPNAVFWGTTGLKDGPLTALLLAMAAIALRPLTMRRLAAATALVAIGFMSRPVLALVCLVIMVVPVVRLLRGRLRGPGAVVPAGTRIPVLFVGLPVLVLVSVLLAARYVHLLKSTLAGDASLSLGSGPVTVSFTPSATSMLRSLLGPFPWAFNPGTDTVYRALYPGMIVWILMLPAVAFGCWELIRRGSWAAKGIVVSALVYLYLYAVVFQNQGFFRQRYTVELLLLVVGLYAFARRPQLAQAWTAAGACVMAVAAPVQARVFPLSGLALLLLVVPALYVRGDFRPLAFAHDTARRLGALPGRTVAWPRPPDRGFAEERDITSGLARATSTGVRVMGLWILANAVGFVASALISRQLGPAGRGLYTYPVALLGIMVAFGHIGLEFAQIHLASQGQDLRRMWANATVVSVLLGGLCWAGLAIVVVIYPRTAGGLPLWWLAVPAGLVPVALMNLYWASLLQIDSRLVVTAHASWIGAAVQAVAVGVLYSLHELTPFRVLLMQWLLNGSTWLLLLLACRRAGLVSLRPDRVLLRRALAFGVKAYGAQAIFYLVLRVDQVLVRGYAGYSQLGLYALATTVAEMLWLMTDPLAAALIPHQVRASSGDGHRLSFAMARRSLWISMTAAAGAWLLAPLAIRLVYGSAFVGAVPALRLLLPGVVALGATRPLRAMLLKEGRAVVLTVLGLGTLCANVALNVALLPRIGIRGSSIASSVCYAALALSTVVLARRQARPRVRDDDPLRVTFVVGTLNRGGTERQLLLLGSALAARGHQVMVICLVSEGHQGAVARAAGIRVAEIGFPSLHRSLVFRPSWLRRQLLPAVQRLRGILRETSPDVVHCFLYWGYLIGVPAARSVRVPVVVSSRRSLTAAVGRIRLLSPWERACDRLAGAVVCNSAAVMEDAIARSGLPRRKAVVIRNGVQLPTEVAPPGGQPAHIVIVANLHPYKGHAVALTAFARVRAALPTTAARLQLLGSGSAAQALRAQARELGIDEEVDFLGSVADVPALLDGCVFTVLPSLTEGMPNAVLESLAHGRPVVASAVGGVPEILGRGGGILVRPGDPEALAEAMFTLLADPDLAAELGAEGRALVRDRFGVDRMVTDSLRLYHGLLGGRRSRELGAAASDQGPGSRR
jgi:glycosyltransferase involved in cell wall biosynthesis/O-antigen/teichoic acid export membrane protein